MATRLTGLQATNYVGVQAQSPANVIQVNHDPTTRNYQNFFVGDEWLTINTKTTPPTLKFWKLMSVANNQATWVLISSGSAGDVLTLTGNSGGPVSPAAGNINVVGDGATINIVGNPGTNTLTVSTIGTGVVTAFVTDAGFANPIAGIIDIFAAQSGATTRFRGSTNVINLTVTDGIFNTTVGLQSGAGGMSGTLNSAFGFRAGGALTSGTANTFIGSNAGVLVTTGSTNNLIGNGAGSALSSGSNNQGLGVIALQALLTGSNNIAIGGSAGNAFTGAESNNIVLGNVGVVGDANIMRLGTTGTGANQVNTTYIAGAQVNVGSAVSGSAQFLQQDTLGSIGLETATVSVTARNVATTTPDIEFFSSRTGAVVQSGDNIAKITTVVQSTTTQVIGTGQIEWTVDAAPGAGYVPTSLVFSTSSAVTAGGLADRLKISSGGNVSIIGPDAGVIALTSITTFGQTVGGSGVAVVVDNAGNFGTIVSSERYKENIKNMNDLSKVIYKLKPKTFNFKKEPNAQAWGLIAEDVEQVFSPLVSYNKEDKPESVKYNDLITLLLNEVQKLNKRIEKLEATA